jgi:hypothetical protein
MESLLTLGNLLLASTFKSIWSPDFDEEDGTHLLYYTKEGNKETTIITQNKEKTKHESHSKSITHKTKLFDFSDTNCVQEGPIVASSFERLSLGSDADCVWNVSWK